MLPLVGGYIILIIVLFLLWVALASVFSWVGHKIQNKITFFKNKGEVVEDEKQGHE